MAILANNIFRFRYIPYIADGRILFMIEEVMLNDMR